MDPNTLCRTQTICPRRSRCLRQRAQPARHATLPLLLRLIVVTRCWLLWLWLPPRPCRQENAVMHQTHHRSVEAFANDVGDLTGREPCPVYRLPRPRHHYGQVLNTLCFERHTHTHIGEENNTPAQMHTTLFQQMSKNKKLASPVP